MLDMMLACFDDCSSLTRRSSSEKSSSRAIAMINCLRDCHVNILTHLVFRQCLGPHHIQMLVMCISVQCRGKKCDRALIPNIASLFYQVIYRYSASEIKDRCEKKTAEDIKRHIIRGVIRCALSVKTVVRREDDTASFVLQIPISLVVTHEMFKW